MTAPSTGTPTRWGAVAALACVVFGCSPAVTPCLGQTCGATRECLANRCVARGQRPVAEGAARVVAGLTAFATSDEARGSGAANVVLGGHRGKNALYLAFDGAWKTEGEVDSAFLLLEPSVGTAPDRADVTLEVWTVGEPWTPDRVASGTRPSLEPPRASGVLRPYPPSAARIDVTAIARDLSRRQRDDGLAVVVPAGIGEGASVQSGISRGAPRLELYLRRSPAHAW